MWFALYYQKPQICFQNIKKNLTERQLFVKIFFYVLFHTDRANQALILASYECEICNPTQPWFTVFFLSLTLLQHNFNINKNIREIINVLFLAFSQSTLALSPSTSHSPSPSPSSSLSPWPSPEVHFHL